MESKRRKAGMDQEIWPKDGTIGDKYLCQGSTQRSIRFSHAGKHPDRLIGGTYQEEREPSGVFNGHMRKAFNDAHHKGSVRCQRHVSIERYALVFCEWIMKFGGQQLKTQVPFPNPGALLFNTVKMGSKSLAWFWSLTRSCRSFNRWLRIPDPGAKSRGTLVIGMQGGRHLLYPAVWSSTGLNEDCVIAIATPLRYVVSRNTDTRTRTEFMYSKPACPACGMFARHWPPVLWIILHEIIY